MLIAAGLVAGFIGGGALFSGSPEPTAAARQVPLRQSSPAATCHPSYAGRCLPIGPDLDCADVGGRVRVVGPDVYRLDRDRDGIGCE